MISPLKCLAGNYLPVVDYLLPDYFVDIIAMFFSARAFFSLSVSSLI